MMETEKGGCCCIAVVGCGDGNVHVVAIKKSVEGSGELEVGDSFKRDVCNNSAATTTTTSTTTATSSGALLPVCLETKSTLFVGRKPMFLAVDATRANILTMRSPQKQGAIDDGIISGQDELILLHVDRDTWELSVISAALSGGEGACHVAFTPCRRFALAAHYDSGHISCIHYDEAKGALGPLASTVRHGPEGYTQGKGRQDGSHPHQVVVAPDSKVVFVPDLGCNVVNTFNLSPHGILSFRDAMPVRKGAGPRHMVFHPAFDCAYILHELDNGMTICKVDQGDWSITPIQEVVSCIPPDFDGPPPFPFYTSNSHAAEIEISEDGRLLIVTNRGHDSIARFEISRDCHEKVSLADHVMLGQDRRLPWHAVLSRDSQTILATAQYDASLEEGGSVFLVANNRQPTEHRCVEHRLPNEEQRVDLENSKESGESEELNSADQAARTNRNDAIILGEIAVRQPLCAVFLQE